MNPYLNKSYKVTMDNYFTSLQLTIVGTERKDCCKIPNRDTELKIGELYSNESGKKNKNVYLMSTMHPKVITNESHPKKLPQTSKF